MSPNKTSLQEIEMKKKDMIIMHDPDNGIYGDCQRACIATLLEIDTLSVPHFYENGNDEDFFSSLNSYLNSKGFIHLETQPIDFNIPQFDRMGEVYHMIYGESERGFQHAVVAKNGEIIHDPHPSRAGLDESKKDDWHFAFLVKSCA